MRTSGNFKLQFKQVEILNNKEVKLKIYDENKLKS